jgi:hypothetical protein
MPLAGFEPTIPVFKRANTFHVLDRAATVTGIFIFTHLLVELLLLLLSLLLLLLLLLTRANFVIGLWAVKFARK